jgi:hypothetical protein
MKRKAPSSGQESHHPTSKKARVIAGMRVRSPAQKLMRRIQNTHRRSKFRKDAKAALEAERGRSAEEIATLGIKRYNIL